MAVYDKYGKMIKSSYKSIKSSVDEKNPWFEKLSDFEKEAVLFDMKMNPDLIGEYRDELSESGVDYDDYKWAKPTDEWLLEKINRKNFDGKFSYFDETNNGQKRHYAEVFDEYGKSIKSSRINGRSLVKDVLLNNLTEEQAIKKIAIANNCNTGYASQIFSDYMEEYEDGIVETNDTVNDIQKEFNADGDLDSWADEYMPGSGKANTKGGELVRAAQRILTEFYNSGNMIGRGYGNETVNPAARYIIAKTSFDGNDELQDMVDHVVQMTEDEYEKWCRRFETDFTNYLRDKGDLFSQANDDDISNYKDKEDIPFFLNEFYVTDKDGNKYFFTLEDDSFKCTDIQFTTEPLYEVDDIVTDSSNFDVTSDYGVFEKDNYIYDWEATGEKDENDNYTEWKIVRVTIADQLFEIDDILDVSEIEEYDIFDINGNPILDSDIEKL